MHRWAQIREAFLASQWQLGAGRRGACAGGSAAEAAPGLAGARGVRGGGGSPSSRAASCGCSRLGYGGSAAGAGCAPLSSSPQPSSKRALEGRRGGRSPPLSALCTPSGTFLPPCLTVLADSPVCRFLASPNPASSGTSGCVYCGCVWRVCGVCWRGERSGVTAPPLPPPQPPPQNQLRPS